MKLDSVEDALEALEKMKEKLDKMLAPYYPEIYHSNTAGNSLMSKINGTPQKPQKPSEDTLDKLETQAETIFEEYYEDCEEGLEEVFRRLCLLYREAQCIDESVLSGSISLTAFEDEMDQYYEVLLNNIECDDMEAIIQMKAIDAILRGYIDLGSSYDMKDFEKETLQKIADALEEVNIPEGKLYLEHLIRRLEVNLALLIHDIYNSELRESYCLMALDLAIELIKDHENIQLIDKKIAHGHLFHANGMNDFLKEDEMEVMREAYRLTY